MRIPCAGAPPAHDCTSAVMSVVSVPVLGEVLAKEIACHSGALFQVAEVSDQSLMSSWKNTVLPPSKQESDNSAWLTVEPVGTVALKFFGLISARKMSGEPSTKISSDPPRVLSFEPSSR